MKIQTKEQCSYCYSTHLKYLNHLFVGRSDGKSTAEYQCINCNKKFKIIE